ELSERARAGAPWSFTASASDIADGSLLDTPRRPVLRTGFALHDVTSGREMGVRASMPEVTRMTGLWASRASPRAHAALLDHPGPFRGFAVDVGLEVLGRLAADRDR